MNILLLRKYVWKFLRILEISLCSILICALLAMVGACSSLLSLPTSGGISQIPRKARQDRLIYSNPPGPQKNAEPEDIVRGFLDALPSGLQRGSFSVAHEFLSSTVRHSWKPRASSTIYTGDLGVQREARNLDGTGASQLITVAISVSIVGRVGLDGTYQPVQQHKKEILTFKLTKAKSQWRIASLDNGVLISRQDFDQVFRQVTLYQPSRSCEAFIPDVRWFGRHDWKRYALSQLLSSPPKWLDRVVRNIVEYKVSLVSVSGDNSAVRVTVSSNFAVLPRDVQALVVRMIKLTISGHDDDSSVSVYAGENDFTHADKNVKYTSSSASQSVYSVSSRHLLSLALTSAIRVGEIPIDVSQPSFTYSNHKAVIIDGNHRAQCIDSDGSACGVLFDGQQVSYVTAGMGLQVWAVSADGRSVMVAQNEQRTYQRIQLNLPAQYVIRSIAVSPEGERMVVVLSQGASAQTVLYGIVRNDKKEVAGLSDSNLTLSYKSNISMASFYNDTIVVYATNPDGSGVQRAYRQSMPGLEIAQSLPEVPVIAIAAGQISSSQKLAVLCVDRTVRGIGGSLTGGWQIMDTQAVALSQR
ncbi:hypothetical protein [Alloscardovia venturai]